MSGTYERTFSVSVSPERAFRAFTHPDDIEVWFAERFTSGGENDTSDALSVGGEMHFAPTEVVPNERLCYKQWAESPESGIDVTVVFEATEHGTRITFTQAGFGGPTRFSSEPVHGGMDETLADLVLWLEHGVQFPRHRDVTARCGIGAEVVRVPGGMAVTHVAEGGFADQVGIEPGDLLLQLGHGSVFDHTDIAFFQRDHEAGDEVDVVFARDGKVRWAHGRLGPFEMMAWTLAV